MTTAAEPHVGLGVAQYAGATPAAAPGRRLREPAVQIVAMIRGETPRYKRGGRRPCPSARLRPGLQRLCRLPVPDGTLLVPALVYPENVSDVTALWVKDDLVRIDGLPLAVRVAGLPEMQPGERVRLQVARIDELALEIEFRVLGQGRNGLTAVPGRQRLLLAVAAAIALPELPADQGHDGQQQGLEHRLEQFFRFHGQGRNRMRNRHLNTPVIVNSLRRPAC